MTIIQADFSKRSALGKNKADKKVIPIYQFHVSLSFSEPLIWRRIQVPGNVTLKQFHKVLQLSMGWTGEHNHQFYVGKVFYNAGLSSGNEEYYEGNVELQGLEEAMRWCFTYMYDAGDGWEHEIVLEEVETRNPEKKIPVILDGEWAAPPEEIGSVHVYEKVLWAIENPRVEGSKNLIAHHGVEGFNPYLFEHKKINSELSKCSWGI